MLGRTEDQLGQAQSRLGQTQSQLGQTKSSLSSSQSHGAQCELAASLGTQDSQLLATFIQVENVFLNAAKAGNKATMQTDLSQMQELSNRAQTLGPQFSSAVERCTGISVPRLPHGPTGRDGRTFATKGTWRTARPRQEVADMLARKLTHAELTREGAQLAPTYGSRQLREPVPRYELPDRQMPAQAAYQIVHDELNLDGNPALNLASFVTTWMEAEADKLMSESFGRNFIDADEYPQTTEIQNRCVNMIARLFHAPEHETAVGCATVGSSEAIHLAGLALKWRWRARRQAQGKATSSPNIVMGANVQVCWEKFARYFEVEPRFVPLSAKRYVIGVEEALALVDEGTIGVVGVLGSTYTGEYEPVAELNDALLELNSRTGWDVPVHVDAASGGFRRPFYPAGTGLGLPSPPGALDQCFRPQVRPGLPRCGVGGLAS